MKTGRLWIYRLLTFLMPETRCFGIKATILRWCGAEIGKNVRVCSSAVISGAGRLSIGDDVWIGEGCFISPNAGASVVIESNCDLGPRVMILNGSHEIDIEGDHIAGKGVAGSVYICSGCWIGAQSIILPGMKLLPKTIVAAGAVVIKSPSCGYVLLAGNPAIVKKHYAYNN